MPCVDVTITPSEQTRRDETQGEQPQPDNRPPRQRRNSPEDSTELEIPDTLGNLPTQQLQEQTGLSRQQLAIGGAGVVAGLAALTLV